MNGAWGYNASLENAYKTPASLIQEMIRVARSISSRRSVSG
jgi:hypothetical protein